MTGLLLIIELLPVGFPRSQGGFPLVVELALLSVYGQQLLLFFSFERFEVGLFGLSGGDPIRQRFFLLLKLYFPLVQGDLLFFEHHQLMVGGGVLVGPLGLQLGPGLGGGLFGVFLGGGPSVFNLLLYGIKGIKLILQSDRLLCAFQHFRMQFFGLFRSCHSILDGLFLNVLQFAGDFGFLVLYFGQRQLVHCLGQSQNLAGRLVDLQPGNTVLKRKLFYNPFLISHLSIVELLRVIIRVQRIQHALNGVVFLFDNLDFLGFGLYGLVQFFPALFY